MSLYAIPMKNYLGVLSHSDSRRLLVPPPILSKVSLLLDFAAEITGLVLAEYHHSPDNSFYVSSVLFEAVEAHLERAFGIELNPSAPPFFLFWYPGFQRIAGISKKNCKLISHPENGTGTS